MLKANRAYWSRTICNLQFAICSFQFKNYLPHVPPAYCLLPSAFCFRASPAVHSYRSLTTTRRIESPRAILSITSIPRITRPKTV